MSAWIECTRCGAQTDLGPGDEPDNILARVASRHGWTIIGHFGAKSTRCRKCRQRQRFWHVTGSNVRHRQRRCSALIGNRRACGPPTIWPKTRKRRTAEPARELTAREASGLRDCHYCGEMV